MARGVGASVVAVAVFCSGILFGRHIEDQRSVRGRYVEEVSGIAITVDYMRSIGRKDQEIAETASMMRRGIGAKYKHMTPGVALSRIKDRNRQKYGDELGPTIQWLRDRGTTWVEIIDDSSRTIVRPVGSPMKRTRRPPLIDAIRERLEAASSRKWKVEEAQECVYVARCCSRDEIVCVDGYHRTYEEVIEMMVERWTQSNATRLTSTGMKTSDALRR